MRRLPDTHVFLWWIADDFGLTPRCVELMAEGGNELLLSAASGWEIAIKAGLWHISW